MKDFDKINKAWMILEQCFGEKGVWADPTRYKYQCWTRDFVFAVMPVLLALGQNDIVRTHLENISKRQRPDGKIPILFLDRVLPFLTDKIKRSISSRKISFMLRRYLAGQIENLTPGTKDSEILYLVGMYEYAERTKDQSLLVKYSECVRKALAYIEVNLMQSGLVIGCDWRDTMHVELGDKALLTNNCLMYRAYILMREEEKAEKLRLRINEWFWNGSSYIDYMGNDRFDPLGGAFAVLFNIAPEERYASLIDSFHSVDTPFGVAIKCRHNPVNADEKEVIERTDGVVVWPFVVGFTSMALRKMKEYSFADKELRNMTALPGFREWYDPATGKGYGAIEQLWSAVLLLRAASTV